ncbi:MAG: protein-export chaperone SecB [Sphingomonas sp.]|nr:protein-export chaperone SecB [Sphingomonas sp.]
MAHQDSTPAGNGPAGNSPNGNDPAGSGPVGNGADGDDTQPQAATLAQYIKDLSVESPSAPVVFQWQDQPSLDVNFNLNVERVSDDVNEVLLKIEVRAHSQNGVHFLVDLSYGGLFGLRNFPEEAIAPFLLIEAPRLLFPFARQIICESITNMGFPPLLLEPIDFAAAYMAQMQAVQEQQVEAGELEETGSEQPADEGAGDR